MVLSDGVFVVNTTADSGPGSLRQAILDSDTVTGGGNTIDFTIPGQGVHSIALDSPLPAVTSTVVIDGTSQPGYTGTPLIQLNVEGAGTTDGLSITGSDVTLRGLMTDGFSFGSSTDSASVTLPSVALPPSSAGAVATYRIDTIAAGELVAVVTPQGLTTELSLLDSQGDVLVQSDGLSPVVPDDVIDQHVPPGTYFLRVNRTAGEGTYTLTTMVSLAAAPFEPIPGGSGGPAVTAGDFNGDGKLDLAVAAEFSNDVSVLLGNGDGTFQPAVEYAVGQEPDALVAGDFNGDGKLDLAVANWKPLGDGNVSVLLGNGDGTFQPAQQYAVGQYPSSIVAGDFNGDGRLDLAVANENPFGIGNVSVLLGNGDGTFQPQVTYAVESRPIAIVAGDFGGDGRTDLAVANYYSNDVSVLLGNGDGTFQPEVSYAVGSFPRDIVAADFTGDGRLDLAATDEAGTVSVLLSNSGGTFQPQVTYAVGSSAVEIVAGDFTGDGHQDLFVSDVAGILWVLPGSGDGTFQPAEALGAQVTGELVAGDFNGDGRLDLAGSSEILLGNGNGTFQREQLNAVGTLPEAIVAGDFNGDGRLDVAVANAGDNTVSVLLGNGDGTFQPQVTYAVGSFPDAIVAGDFNGDGRLDLAVVTADDTVSVLLGNGDGTFQPPYAVGSGAVAVVAGDFNGDGRLDLAVAGTNNNDATNTVRGEVSVLLGNGDGTFQAAQQYAVGGYPNSIVAGDFNGDGKLDLAVSDQGNELGGATDPGGVSVLLDNGDGTFEPAVYYAVGPDPSAIVAGDFTSDGRTDLAVSDSDGVQILLGNGDGTFQPASTVAAGTQGVLVAGDFNGDGHTDLAVASNYSGISVLLGNGDGTFQPQVTYSGGGYPFVEGDFNGDGRPDLAAVAAVNGAGAVSLLLGNGDGTFEDAGQFATTPHATPLVADVNGDGTDDVLVIDSAGDILYRLGIPGHPGTFEPPVTVNPGCPSRDIAWLPNTGQGQLLASVDARDDAVSFYAWRYGGFVRVGSLATGHLPAQIIAADLNDNGWDDLVVRNAGDGSLSIYFNASDATVPVAPFDGPLTPVQEAFGFRVTLPAGPGVSDVQAVDTTGTGRLDLVVTNELTGQVSILRNLGDDTFGPPAAYRGGTALSGLDTSSGTPEVTSLEATASVAAGAFVTGGPTDLITANPGSSRWACCWAWGRPVRQSRCYPDAEPGPGNPRGRLHSRRHSRPGRPHEQRAEHLPQQWQRRLCVASDLRRARRILGPDCRRRQSRRQPRPARRRCLRRRAGALGQRQRDFPALPRSQPVRRTGRG